MPINPIQPEGLKQSPVRPVEIPLQQPIKVNEPPITTGDVNWFDLIKLWVKENLINDILNSQKGVVMDSKVWYFSKTLWVNVLTIGWQFLAPVIGLPVLTAETMVILLGVVNFILRLITKSAVSIG